MLLTDPLDETRFPLPFAGVDEVGRGCLAGPVLAAAVMLPLGYCTERLADSKTLPAKERESIAVCLRRNAQFGIGMASVEEIDRLNIHHATLLAMHRAIVALPAAPAFALVDGKFLPRALPCPAEAVVKGDGRSACIAAASILAKVTRDAMMRELARAHPAYGWCRNAGYGTKRHRAALEVEVTLHHRRSFRPVREALERLAAASLAA